MKRRYLEPLLIVLIAGVCSALGPNAAIHPLVRLIASLPLVLFLPGYAAVRAAAPDRSLGLLERLVLALGASLSIAALGAVLLHVTPFGIQAFSWVSLLLLISVLGAAVLAVRGGPDSARSAASAERAAIVVTPTARGPLAGHVVAHATLFGVASMIVVAAYAVAIAAFNDQPRPGFAQLWISRSSEPATVTIGVRNEEDGAIEARVELQHGASVVAEWPLIVLGVGQTWEGTATVPEFPGSSDPLEAVLTRSEFPDTPYRRVTLWP